MRRAPFRVVDTGLGSAEVNIAIDRHWLVGHAQGERDNLLRFYRSTPSAWVGLHQWPERELRLHYCHRKGIDVVRRLTGGATLYVDDRQLGFSLILKWTEKLADAGLEGIVALGAMAVVDALRDLGIAAQFEAPNDITVPIGSDRRKLASLFASRHRGALLLQGVLLLTADVGRVLNALRLPSEPAANGAGPHPARERLTALDQVTSRAPTPAHIRKALVQGFAARFNLRTETSTKTVYTTLREPPHIAAWPAGLDRPAHIPTTTAYWRDRSAADNDLAEALWQSPAGLLRARLRWDPLRRAPSWLEIGGDVQVYPLDLFARLAQGLAQGQAGVNAADLPAALRELCAHHHAVLSGFDVEDLLAVLTRAWDRAEQQRAFGLTVAQANRLTVVNAPAMAANTAALAQQADTLVLPYCARPPECRGKSYEECAGCDGCEVGAACRSANEHGLRIREMTKYAELDGLLEQLRAEGSKGVVGMTCQTFFIKHSGVFTRAGLPMLLVDLGGSTCYEQHREAEGYAGRFPYKTTLDVPVLERVVRVREVG